ncbi:MAG: chromate resistance protein ChrB domain-containing protein, partial [Hyphomicrobiaceae bacterium]
SRHPPKRRSVNDAERKTMGKFLISIDELKDRIGTADCPPIFDVRRRPFYDEQTTILPTARWRDHMASDHWMRGVAPGTEVVVYCVHAHNVSQCAVAALRARSVNARVLERGIEGWKEAGGLVIAKDALPHRDEDIESVWVTRIRPKIDRIACPWLIRRFINREAQFLFVEPEQVVPVAGEIGGIPYDVPDVDLSHEGENCTFDTLIKRFAINDPALARLADIVRGADTARPGLAPEAAGLLAVSLGISALSGDNDHAAVERGMQVYDALYAWQRYAADETHNWPSAQDTGQAA